VAILEGHFSKIEQVKKFKDVLKSSAPKDTEVTASMAATDLDPKLKPLR
jgi:hypothetical protein